MLSIEIISIGKVKKEYFNDAIKEFSVMRQKDLTDMKKRIHAEEMLADLRRKEMLEAREVIEAQESVIDFSSVKLEEAKQILSASERVAGPVLVDPKFRSFDLYKKVKLFKPNFKELAKGLDLDFEKKEIDKLAKAIKKFQIKQQIENLLVTLSDQGVLNSGDGELVHIPAVKREITDVSGAGDTVIAVAALCLISGLTPAEAAAVSNLAGGQVCEKAGVVPVSSEKLLAECREYFKSS